MIRESLRRLRGRNQWRGTEIFHEPKGLVRLQAEARGGELRDLEVHIHLQGTEMEIWAETVPGGRKFALKDYKMDVDAFMTDILEVLRGKPYLRTSSSNADYRKQD